MNTYNKEVIRLFEINQQWQPVKRGSLDPPSCREVVFSATGLPM